MNGVTKFNLKRSVYVASQFAGSSGPFTYLLCMFQMDLLPIGQPPEENGYD